MGRARKRRTILPRQMPSLQVFFLLLFLLIFFFLRCYTHATAEHVCHPEFTPEIRQMCSSERVFSGESVSLLPLVFLAMGQIILGIFCYDQL